MSRSLNRAIIKSVSGRLSTYIVQFVALAIYARLFTPEEFGVIASIQVFVIFFQMLADIGIGPAIINEEDFGHDKRDGVFSVTALTGVVLATVFFIFSYGLNAFYNYEYQNIAFIVCVAILFNSLSILPITALNKDTKFIHIAIVDVLGEFIALIIVYYLYVNGAGVLALAARTAVIAISKFILVWFISFKTVLGRPKFGAELRHIKTILSFSLYQFGFNFINYFSRNLDNILIAKYFGMSSVGIYDKAYQLMRYPLMLTTFAMTPAIQPALMKYRSDKEQIIKEHNNLTMRLFSLSLPINVFVFLNSKDIVLILFGPQWLAVVPLIEIFAFMIPIQAVLSTSGSFFQVMNKPRLLFFSGIMSAVVNVTAIITGIAIGSMEAVALGLFVGFSVNFLQAYYLLFRYCFNYSSMGFYLKMTKSICLVTPPMLLYSSLSVSISYLYELSSISSLFINFLTLFFVLSLFFVPIKKHMFYPSN